MNYKKKTTEVYNLYSEFSYKIRKIDQYNTKKSPS